METILKNIEKDIETTEQHLKELKKGGAVPFHDKHFAVRVYETMLSQLRQQRREVKEYIEEAGK